MNETQQNEIWQNEIQMNETQQNEIWQNDIIRKAFGRMTFLEGDSAE